MKKICCIFNTPSLYRESIYKKIEKGYDCEWHFETTDNNLETFDTTQLKSVSFHDPKQIGPFYIVNGLFRLIRNKEINDYLMMGHSHNLTTFLMILAIRLFYRKKKTYLWTHGLYGKETKLEYTWKKIMFKLANHIFVYGDYSANLMRKSGITKQKIDSIHNSLDYDTQLKLRESGLTSNIYYSHFQNDNPVLIFIGRLNAVKRLDYIIKAVAELNNMGKFFNLVFIGDGPERSNLKNEVKNHSLEHQVWFYGSCYDERKNAELVYNADLCVAPGNIGLTAIHALMFGCPAISHDDFSHQMPEFEVIKRGISGDFFQKGNITSLTETIFNWFENDRFIRDEIRQNCYKIIDTEWNPYYQMSVLKKVIL